MEYPPSHRALATFALACWVVTHAHVCAGRACFDCSRLCVIARVGQARPHSNCVLWIGHPCYRCGEKDWHVFWHQDSRHAAGIYAELLARAELYVLARTSSTACAKLGTLFLGKLLQPLIFPVPHRHHMQGHTRMHFTLTQPGNSCQQGNACQQADSRLAAHSSSSCSRLALPAALHR